MHANTLATNQVHGSKCTQQRRRDAILPDRDRTPFYFPPVAKLPAVERRQRSYHASEEPSSRSVKLGFLWPPSGLVSGNLATPDLIFNDTVHA
mmetsp:Transcript_18736/g.43109  ORF Transcript_18736/g.43109 Transcript_18736/m.43109 type:complete len:93 (-) Transcript_18736:802-1080(-)